MNKALPFIISLLSLIISCSKEPEINEFRPDQSAIETIGWQCHRTIDIIEATDIPQHLAITTHSSKVSYPGIKVPWLKGDISDIDTVQIIFNNPDSTKRFELFLWDGVGSLYYENRFNLSVKFSKGPIDTIIIPLTDGLQTISGRDINLKDIQTAVFYTSQCQQPFTFDLFDIILK